MRIMRVEAECRVGDITVPVGSSEDEGVLVSIELETVVVLYRSQLVCAIKILGWGCDMVCGEHCTCNKGERIEGEVWHRGCVWYISRAVISRRYNRDGIVLGYRRLEEKR